MRSGLLIALAVSLSLLSPPPLAPQTSPLRIAVHTDEGPLNPFTFRTALGYNLLTLVFDTLLWPDADNVPRPSLAEHVESDRSGTRWTVRLRRGVRWHDGRPLTAEDVRFTFEYVARHRHPNWTVQVEPVQRIEVAGPYTVRIVLREPVAFFRNAPLASLPILPRHVWEEVSDPHRFTGPIIGSGPYRLVEYVSGRFYRLRANDVYFVGKPHPEEIVLPILLSAETTFLAFEAGEIDAFSRNLAPELVPRFYRLPGVRLLRGPGFASVVLQFNHERFPLNERAFRRAVALSLNLKYLTDLLLLGFGVPGSPAFVHPATPWWNPHIRARYDPEEARRLVEGLGLVDRDGDGIRETPDGQRMAFSILAQSNDPIRIRAAELISTVLRRQGIYVETQVLDFATVQARIFPDQDACKTRAYEMAIWGRSAITQLDPEWLRRLFHGDCRIGVNNQAAYRNPEFDRLAERQAVTTDERERMRLVWRMQEILAEDVPIVTLFYPDLLFAVRPQRYDGWVFQKGQGILHKLSFVPAPR